MRTLCSPAIVEPRHVDQNEPAQGICAQVVSAVTTSSLPMSNYLWGNPIPRRWTAPDTWMLGSPSPLMMASVTSSQP